MRVFLNDEGRRGAVVGQALTGDVHHPVQHEKEHGDDGRGTHTAFLEEGADGRSDEKQQHTGQRLGKLFPDFRVCAVDQLRITGRFHDLVPGRIGKLGGTGCGVLQGSLFVRKRGPGTVVVHFHYRRGLFAPAGVQLFPTVYHAHPQELFHVPPGPLGHQVR